MSANSVRVVRCRRNLKRKVAAFLGGCCVKCGYSKCVEALEFHHRDPSQKDFSIGSDGSTRSISKLLEEAKKCDLLCANCHREIHAEWFKKKAFEGELQRRLKWPSKDDLSSRVQVESLTTIASCFGVGRSTVRYWCKELEVPLPKHGARDQGAKMVTRKNPTLWPPSDLLRKLVWSKPVLQVSKDIGVSEVAVKKHCKRSGIDTPPRGYWAKLRAVSSSNT